MKNETMATIFENAHAVAINMNDTFYYACADFSCIDKGELEDLEPVIEKYGQEAFVAYEAIRRGHDPIVPDSVTPAFNQAKTEIKKIMDEHKPLRYFFSFFGFQRWGVLATVFLSSKKAPYSSAWFWILTVGEKTKPTFRFQNG